MAEIREAAWVDLLPVGEDTRSFVVGHSERASVDPHEKEPYRYFKVTQITVQRDLPGLHCDLWRVCVWADEGMIAEVPLHNVAGVGYKVEEQADAEQAG